jgi:hypothetical protein
VDVACCVWHRRVGVTDALLCPEPCMRCQQCAHLGGCCAVHSRWVLQYDLTHGSKQIVGVLAQLPTVSWASCGSFCVRDRVAIGQASLV